MESHAYTCKHILDTFYMDKVNENFDYYYKYMETSLVLRALRSFGNWGFRDSHFLQLLMCIACCINSFHLLSSSALCSTSFENGGTSEPMSQVIDNEFGQNDIDCDLLLF